MTTKSKSRVIRDVRSLFPRISKKITMLYSEGSVEVKTGHYVENSDIEAKINDLKGYRFA